MAADDDERLRLVAGPQLLQFSDGRKIGLVPVVAAVQHDDLAAQVAGGHHATPEPLLGREVAPVVGAGHGGPHDEQKGDDRSSHHLSVYFTINFVI